MEDYLFIDVIAKEYKKQYIKCLTEADIQAYQFIVRNSGQLNVFAHVFTKPYKLVNLGRILEIQDFHNDSKKVS